MDAYGYSDKCPRCEHALKYGNGRSNLPHSDACRQRIMEKLNETPDGRRRIAEFEMKTDRYTSEQIEKQENEPNPETDAAAQGGIAGGDGRQQAVPEADGPRLSSHCLRPRRSHCTTPERPYRMSPTLHLRPGTFR